MLSYLEFNEAITKIDHQEIKRQYSPTEQHFTVHHDKSSKPVKIIINHTPKGSTGFVYIPGSPKDANKLGISGMRQIGSFIKQKIPQLDNLTGIRTTGARKDHIGQEAVQRIDLKENLIITKPPYHSGGNSHRYEISHPNLSKPARVAVDVRDGVGHVNIGENGINSLGPAIIRQIGNFIKNDIGISKFQGKRVSGAGPGRIQKVTLEENLVIKKVDKLTDNFTEFSDGKGPLIRHITHVYQVNHPKLSKPVRIYAGTASNTKEISIDVSGNDPNKLGFGIVRQVAKHIKNDLGDGNFSGLRTTGARRSAPMDKIVSRVNVKEEVDIYDTQDLEEFSEHLKEKHGIHVDLYKAHGNQIHLQTLIVPKELRGQGLASAAITDIKKYADRNKVKIILNAEPLDSKTKEKKLIAFYKSHGFVENKGRNKDYSVGGVFGKNSMYAN